MRDTIETIEKRETHIQRKIDSEVTNAKKLSAAGKKREALQCIKRKKMYEKQLEQISNTKMTLEQQQITLESMNLNREVLAAQRQAAQSMQQQTQAMGGVDAVDETMDAVEDGLNDAEEIAEALSRSIATPGIDADEDDLLAELEGLEEEDLASQIGAVDLTGAAEQGGIGQAMPSVPTPMPSVPTSAPAAMTAEERELAELEASMAM